MLCLELELALMMIMMIIMIMMDCSMGVENLIVPWGWKI